MRYVADDDVELVGRTLGLEEMVVVAQSSSRKTARSDPDRWIGFPVRTSKEDFGRLLRARLASAGLEHTDIMNVDSLSVQKRLVESGFGLALLPRSSVREELRARTLKVVQRRAVATNIPVTLVHRRRGYLSPAGRELLELLTDTWARGLVRP